MREGRGKPCVAHRFDRALHFICVLLPARVASHGSADVGRRPFVSPSPSRCQILGEHRDCQRGYHDALC